MDIEGLSEDSHAEGGGAPTEKAQEAFRDAQKAGAQQAAQQKIQEQNARQKEDRITALIRRLLNSNTDSDILLLLSRCLGKNIPAGFLVGILALIEQEARDEFEHLIGKPLLPSGMAEASAEYQALALAVGAHTHQHTTAEPTTTALMRPEDFDTKKLPPHIKAAISSWAAGLLSFAESQPTRTIVTTRAPDGSLYLPLLQLTAVILQKFLATEHIEAPREPLREFGELLIKSVLDRVESETGERMKLGGG